MEKLDIEFLQKLAYDRSKIWSSYFESYENESLERLEDIQQDFDITEIEQIVSPAIDDELSDDLLSMEDDEYDDNVKSEFLKNASNTSQFALFFGNSAADLSAITKNDDEKQYVDIINKTLPILSEHERQLQEHGFDKVLISFKRDAIENKFGSWLNRHNSLFGGDNTLVHDSERKNHKIIKEVTTYQKPMRGRYCFDENEEMDNDSDASLQSGETARYIRSSRAGTVKNSMTTMIKTYRTVRRTREALREKYACETDEDDYHQNALRIRKKLTNMEYPNPYITPFARSRRNERAEFTARTQKRKVLRKRINDDVCNLDYSSSDSECYENYKKFHCRNLKCCCNRRNHSATNFYSTPLITPNRNLKTLKSRSAMKMSSALRNRCYYFSRSFSSSSSSSASFNSDVEKRRVLKRSAKFSNDNRPRKRESECCCFHDKEVCEKFKHVVDTSAAECYVHNGCTRKEELKTPVITTQTPQTKSREIKIATSTFIVSEKKQINSKNKNNLKENKSKSKNESIKIEDSDNELQMALKASKKTYDKEQKKRLKRELSGAQKVGKEKKIKTTMRKRRLTKIEENVLEKTVTPSQDTYRVTKKSNATAGLTTKAVNESNDEVFFPPTQIQTICNSTALSCKDQAFKRQFAVNNEEADTGILTDKTVINLKGKSKKKTSSTGTSKENVRIRNGATSLAVTSTTLQSPELNFSLTLVEKEKEENSKKMDQNYGKTCDEQNDCAHVTSTTNIEISKTKTANTETEKAPQQKQILNRYVELSRNSVLIYSPETRHMASANSFTFDGYFTLTHEHLSTLIDERLATKFLKYYVGPKRFTLDSVVYYKPPCGSFLSNSLSTSSESFDELEGFDLYGDLIAITDKK